jgi:hypothetical protein
VAAFYDQVSDLSNFVISFTPDPKGDFAVFARAYALAADRLASRLLEEPRFSDYEAYPVMFLYRHAFELFLKHIIYAAAVFAMFADLDRSASALKNTHDLPKLSGAAADLLGCLFPHDASLRLVMDSAMQTAREFEEIDPESYSYRYPIDRKGLHSTKRHQVVNLRAASEWRSKLELRGKLALSCDQLRCWISETTQRKEVAREVASRQDDRLSVYVSSAITLDLRKRLYRGSWLTPGGLSRQKAARSQNFGHRLRLESWLQFSSSTVRWLQTGKSTCSRT